MNFMFDSRDPVQRVMHKIRSQYLPDRVGDTFGSVRISNQFLEYVREILQKELQKTFKKNKIWVYIPAYFENASWEGELAQLRIFEIVMEFSDVIGEDAEEHNIGGFFWYWYADESIPLLKSSKPDFSYGRDVIEGFKSIDRTIKKIEKVFKEKVINKKITYENIEKVFANWKYEE